MKLKKFMKTTKIKNKGIDYPIFVGAGSINILGKQLKLCCKSAKKIALSIANSPLVKTAIAGEDPNWGRIIDAVGYSGAKVDEQKVDIFFGEYAGALGGEAAITPIGKLKKEVSSLRNKINRPDYLVNLKNEF